MNSVFKDKIQQAKAQQATPAAPAAKSEEVAASASEDVEIPYSDYSRENHKPFAVEYFGLGDHWNDPDGGYYQEIQIIDDYFADQVGRGKIANTITSIKKFFKEIEKINDLKDEERIPVKIGTITAYIKFLKETERYGTA